MYFTEVCIVIEIHFGVFLYREVDDNGEVVHPPRPIDDVATSRQTETLTPPIPPIFIIPREEPVRDEKADTSYSDLITTTQTSTVDTDLRGLSLDLQDKIHQ